MFKLISKHFDWNGEKITIETGKIARQANSSIIIKMRKVIHFT